MSPAEPTQGATFRRVRDELGRAICDGTLPAGSVLTIEALEARTGASRSIVREAVRVLGSMGLVVSRQRVGVTVRAAGDWDRLDPQVIGWMLAAPAERTAQLRDLHELRLAIEPLAARLAAGRRTKAEATDLLAAADALREAAAGAEEDFLCADVALHERVLRASGNRAFVRLGELVTEALRDRALEQRAATPPAETALRFHTELAEAIAAGEEARAEALMTAIILEATPAAD